MMRPRRASAAAKSSKTPARLRFVRCYSRGLGDFYLGYRWYAFLEILGATFLWALFVTVLVPAVRARGFSGVLIALPVLVFVALLHGGDAVLTRAKARTGLHSLDRALPTGDPQQINPS